MTEPVLFCREMPPSAAELRWLRADLRAASQSWQLDARQMGLLLVLATELATNVIEYAGTPSVVLVTRRGGALRVTVDDHSLLPLVDGFHLQVITAVASAWGCSSHETGKTVWAELDVTNSPGPP